MVGSAALAGVLAWGVASDDSFSAFASLLGARPATSVRTSRPQVGILVDAPSSLAAPIAAQLERGGGGASIAISGDVEPGTVGVVRGGGSDLIPQLKGGGPIRWVGTRQQIKHMAKQLGESGRIYYAPPSHGFTLTQELLGKTAGATAIRGRMRLAGPRPLTGIRRGDIVEVSAAPGTSWSSTLAWLCAELKARHLRAVPADELFRKA